MKKALLVGPPRDNYRVSTARLRDAREVLQSHALEVTDLEVPDLRVRSVFGALHNVRSLFVLLWQARESSVVWISVGPFVSLIGVPGLWLLRKRIVVDFRDPLHLPSLGYRHPKTTRRIASWLLSLVSLRLSNIILNVTSEITRKTEEAFPLNSHKLWTWQNGFDIPVSRYVMISTERAQPHRSRIRAGVIGRFAYYSQEFAELIAGVMKQLNDERVIVELHHWGCPEKELEEALCRAGLPDRYRNYGATRREKALTGLYSTCDIAIASSNRHARNVKVLEYIGLQMPVLAFLSQDHPMRDEFSDISGFYPAESRAEAIEALYAIASPDVSALRLSSERYYRLSRQAEREDLDRFLSVRLFGGTPDRA